MYDLTRILLLHIESSTRPYIAGRNRRLHVGVLRRRRRGLLLRSSDRRLIVAPESDNSGQCGPRDFWDGNGPTVAVASGSCSFLLHITIQKILANEWSPQALNNQKPLT